MTYKLLWAKPPFANGTDDGPLIYNVELRSVMSLVPPWSTRPQRTHSHVNMCMYICTPLSTYELLVHLHPDQCEQHEQQPLSTWLLHIHARMRGSSHPRHA